MKPTTTIFCGNIVLDDRVLPGGAVRVAEGRIAAVGGAAAAGASAPGVGTVERVDAGDGYIAPGFVDIHVHGGAGADFMDGTDAAFAAALTAHARHGTTSLAVTTTVARHDQIMTVLETTRRFRQRPDAPGARVLGAHFYGPYFRYEARGAHPGGAIRAPVAAEYSQYLEYADSLVTCTVAPELPGASSSSRPARPGACGPTPGIPGPRSPRWPRRCAGACGMSTICIAPCPTRASCGNFRCIPCKAACSKPPCTSTS